ncbi:MAG: TolC family protein [Odoribacter sp.]|nr:TolC family protein [Odoribacter sp.]MDY3033717.1 TolC family protein [Odoribacter sp.]
MRKLLIIVAVLLSVSQSECFAQEIVLNLQKCREMAVENSKKMQVAAEQQKKAGYDWKSYRANFLPKISGSGLYAYMHKKMNYKIDGGYLPIYQSSDVGQAIPLNSMQLGPDGKPVMGADGLPLFKQYAFLPDIELALGLRNVYSVGVMLEQPVYMGGKVRSAFKMASIGKEMAELNVHSSRAQVLTESDEAYWQYVRVKEQLKSAEKYLEVVSELVKNVTDAIETGMASQNDLLKAQVKQNEAELLVSKANNGVALSRMNLCRVIGVDLYSQVDVNDSLCAESTLNLLDMGNDITARPEYNLLEKQVELKSKEVALTRADFLPQLGVSASYAYGDGISLNGESDGVASFAAVASLKIPIYHWGEGRNKVKAVKAEQEMARLQQEELSQMMQLEVAKTRFNVEDAAARVKMTEKSLSQAEENLQVSRNRYEVGMETITNYMEAQAQWQKAWSDAIDARAELRLSETYYLKATGKLQ